MLPILINALRETLYMVLYASLFSMLVGIPLGMFVANLANTKTGFGRTVFLAAHSLLQFAKIPYILMMLLFIPTTNWLINHNVSFATATIVPLSVAGSLLLAQTVYDKFVALFAKWQVTAKAMGATNNQTLLLIVFPESLDSIVEACASTASTIVGFSIIAGAFGAGGLGQLAIEKTITEPNFFYAIISIIALIAIQQVLKYTAILFIQPKH